jgi:hypothetical protein
MPKVFAFIRHGKKVLLGAGAQWILDVTPKDKQDELAESQRSYEKTKAKAETELLGRVPGDAIMKPVEKRPKYYTTKFISTKKKDRFPIGFIKGDKESTDTSSQHAIAREVEEETFTRFPPSRFVEITTNVYILDVDDAEATAIYRNWHSQYTRRIGELVKLKWVDIDKVDEKQLNPESKRVLKHLPAPGGGSRRVFSQEESKMVKTRSMTRRARRGKSHCVGIKRSAVCKRTEGCKYASGTKRRFCRTSKNRKHMSKGL